MCRKRSLQCTQERAIKLLARENGLCYSFIIMERTKFTSCLHPLNFDTSCQFIPKLAHLVPGSGLFVTRLGREKIVIVLRPQPGTKMSLITAAKQKRKSPKCTSSKVSRADATTHPPCFHCAAHLGSPFLTATVTPPPSPFLLFLQRSAKRAPEAKRGTQRAFQRFCSRQHDPTSQTPPTITPPPPLNTGGFSFFSIVEPPPSVEAAPNDAALRAPFFPVSSTCFHAFSHSARCRHPSFSLGLDTQRFGGDTCPWQCAKWSSRPAAIAEKRDANKTLR